MVVVTIGVPYNGLVAPRDGKQACDVVFASSQSEFIPLNC